MGRAVPLPFKAALQLGQSTRKLISFVKLRISPPSQQVTAMAPQSLLGEKTTSRQVCLCVYTQDMCMFEVGKWKTLLILPYSKYNYVTCGTFCSFFVSFLFEQTLKIDSVQFVLKSVSERKKTCKWKRN